MRKIFLILFVLCSGFFSLSAQQGELMVGLGLHGIYSKGFNRFKESYEQFYANSIDGKFNNHGIPSMLEIGASIYLEKDAGFGFALYFSQQNRGFDIEFKSGNRREIQYEVSTPLDFGLIIGKAESKFKLTPRFGVMNARITSSYFYKDGSQSFNNVSRLNGVYSSFGFFYKVNAEYKVWESLYLMAGFGGGKGNNEFQDQSWAKDFAYGMILFPTDMAAYEQAVNAGNSYDYPDDERLKPGYFQWYVGATYRVKLF